MPRRLIRKLLPPTQALKQHRALQPLGSFIHDPNLWHLNRYSASMATFVGIFCAFIPLPLQTLIAAALAIIIRCNLPIAVVLIWITNPLTITPLFFGAYKVGAWLLGIPPEHLAIHFTTDWLTTQIERNWQPLALGCAVCGLFFGSLGGTIVLMLWRLTVIRRWEGRKQRRRSTTRNEARPPDKDAPHATPDKSSRAGSSPSPPQ